MTTRQQLVTDIFHNMSAMRRLMMSQMPSKTRSDGPTHAQMAVMLAVSHKHLGVKDLAKCFGMTSSAVTQLITGLEKRGWVKRQSVSGDRRKVALHLSPSGQRILKNMITKRAAIFAKHLEALNDKELQQLKAIQDKILAYHS